MSANAIPSKVQFFEDGSTLLMARVTERPLSPTGAGTPFVQANFIAITLTIYDLTTGDVVTGFNGLALTIANVIFDALQGWDVDTTGHNFRVTIGPTGFSTGGHKYRAEVKLTHTDGRVGFALWEGPATHVYGS